MEDFPKETPASRPGCFRREALPAAAHARAMAALLDSRGAPLEAVLLAGLPDRALAGLATLMPHLLCGEESATLAFTGFRNASQGAYARLLWAGIGADERLHEYMLGHLVRVLDAGRPPGAGAGRRAARLFFLRLRSPDAATHFARICALDCFVSRIMAALTSRHSLLHGQPGLMRLFGRIRADESRHVRITRHYLSDAGAAPSALRAERAWVAETFHVFLAPYLPAFDQIGVDPRILINCLH